MSSHDPDPHASGGAPTPHGASSAADPDAEHDPALHDAHGAHDAHDAHAVPGEPPVEPERQPLSALIWPLLILLIVAILVLPAAAQAFSPYSTALPAETSTGTGLETTPIGANTPVVITTASPIPPSTQTSGGPSQGTVIPQVPGAITAQPTNITGPLTTPNSTPATPGATAAPATPSAAAATVAPTQASAPLYNADADALRSLTLGGQTYQVEATDTVADWKFSAQPGVASWVSGTIFPYVVGVPSSAANDPVLKGLQPNDTIRLTVASGAERTFQVTSVQRVPATDVSVLNQNHPGVALLLLGEASTDRLTVLGTFVPQS
jgi:hypothetical protein